MTKPVTTAFARPTARHRADIRNVLAKLSALGIVSTRLSTYLGSDLGIWEGAVLDAKCGHLRVTVEASTTSPARLRFEFTAADNARTLEMLERVVTGLRETETR